MSDTRFCKICSSSAEYSTHNSDIHVNCIRCGEYIITIEFRDDFDSNSLTPYDISKVSGWVREHQKSNLNSKVINKIKTINILPTEKSVKLLQYLNIKTQSPGQEVIINLPMTESSHLLLSICWAYDMKELDYLLDLLRQQGHIMFSQGSSKRLIILPEGFTYLSQIKIVQSDFAFCAMWFDDSMNPVWEFAIEPAIRQSGYKPLRIDKHPYNAGVVDEIISQIRQSKFIIADLTGNRGGVYYEAGFAKGLGREVIFTCRKDFFEKEKTHFDVQHYNFLTWEPDNYNDFKTKLNWRIESTLGKGNNS